MASGLICLIKNYVNKFRDDNFLAGDKVKVIKRGVFASGTTGKIGVVMKVANDVHGHIEVEFTDEDLPNTSNKSWLQIGALHYYGNTEHTSNTVLEKIK